MPSVTLYAKPSGEIVGRGSRDDSGLVSFDTDEMGSIDGVFGADTHYVKDGAALSRPSFSPTPSGSTVVANDSAFITVSGLPPGATVRIDGGAPVAVTDSTVEFSASVAGTYVLLLECWPYKPVSFTFTATPAP